MTPENEPLSGTPAEEATAPTTLSLDGVSADGVATEVIPASGYDPVPAPTPAPAIAPEVYANLNAIETLALFWGGETGTKIRNHVMRIRDLLLK